MFCCLISPSKASASDFETIMSLKYSIWSFFRTVVNMLGCGGKRNIGKSSVGFDREDIGPVLSNSGSYTHIQGEQETLLQFL